MRPTIAKRLCTPALQIEMRLNISQHSIFTAGSRRGNRFFFGVSMNEIKVQCTGIRSNEIALQGWLAKLRERAFVKQCLASGKNKGGWVSGKQYYWLTTWE